MREATARLMKLLDDHGPEPAKVTLCANKKVALRFYVDAHLDRYVDLEDSAESDDFVVVVRNFRDVESGVVGDVIEAVTMVRAELARLGKLRETS